jgi:hypothetical protein
VGKVDFASAVITTNTMNQRAHSPHVPLYPTNLASKRQDRQRLADLARLIVSEAFARANPIGINAPGQSKL